MGSWFLVVLPWLIRNLLLAGGLCFHTLPGLHFLQYSAVAVVMQRDHVAYTEARKQLLAALDSAVLEKATQQGAPVTEYQRCVVGEQLAFRIMRNHPWYACKYAMTELAKTLCALHAAPVIYTDVGRWPVYTAQTTWLEKIRYNLSPPLQTPWLQFIIYWDLLSTLLILFFSLLGLLLLLVRRELHAGIALCVLIAGLLWVVALAYGTARLRLPFEFVMIIIGVYGYVSLCKKASLYR